jgi:phosphatidylglycerophosphate synthase
VPESHLTIPQAIVILADETADWTVAGLRQIDRVNLAARDYFRRTGMAAPEPLIIHANDAVRQLDSLGQTRVLLLSTRLVPARKFQPLIVPASEALSYLPVKSDPENWHYLASGADIARAARSLFSSTGKSQDGVVSRYLNRPLSRGLSRLLVRTPVSPNDVTLLLMLLPLAGAWLLIRGDYLGFAIGAVLFQIHSALDGCDGEIARAKYLESEAGAKLDALCDRFSTLLFAIALGGGLFRQSGSWPYLVEGLAAALCIGVVETFLTRHEIEKQSAPDRYGNFLAAHRQSFNQGDQLKLWMIKHTGLLSLGDGAAGLFSQLTKRDVFNFVFMLLALCGFAAWVLHILAFCACAILALSLKELLAPALDVNSAA